MKLHGPLFKTLGVASLIRHARKGTLQASRGFSGQLVLKDTHFVHQVVRLSLKLVEEIERLSEL